VEALFWGRQKLLYYYRGGQESNARAEHISITWSHRSHRSVEACREQRRESFPRRVEAEECKVDKQDVGQ
jgi:hypothetical protein